MQHHICVLDLDLSAYIILCLSVLCESMWAQQRYIAVLHLHLWWYYCDTTGPIPAESPCLRLRRQPSISSLIKKPPWLEFWRKTQDFKHSAQMLERFPQRKRREEGTSWLMSTWDQGIQQLILQRKLLLMSPSTRWEQTVLCQNRILDIHRGNLYFVGVVTTTEDVEEIYFTLIVVVSQMNIF